MTDWKEWPGEAPFFGDRLGYLPLILLDEDPASFEDQLNNRYAHGGGHKKALPAWRFNHNTLTLVYPGDPPMRPIAHAKFHDSHLYVFDHAWTVLVKDGKMVDIQRLD